MADARDRWNRRYRTEPPPTEPTSLVAEYVDALPSGRVLDVACGGGRNAIFLAERGFEVVGVDVSEVALEHARERARAADADVTFVHADFETFELDAYDVVVVANYRTRERLPDLLRSLEPGGALLYEHRLRVDDEGSFRVESNELLHAALSLRVVHYEEPFGLDADDATVRLVARRPTERSA